MTADILIVDDEADIRNLIRGILEDEEYKTRLASGAREAFEKIEVEAPDLIILDIWLQGSDKDGLEILDVVKDKYPHLPVIMISGHGTIETAVSSIKKGAYDFIEKPFKSDRLLLMIQRALETAELKRENASLKQNIERNYQLIGNTPVIQNLNQVLARVAPTNSRVLLTGEAGAGKEVAARVIHTHSKRAHNPFFVVNCATLRPERLEIELFGSAESKNGEAAKEGILEQADLGTLLLDEVADMPLETQGKILRVLQEQRFKRVGGDKEIKIDVRIMASTNKDLQDAIKTGHFREDLYYRLNVVPLHIPPLREHSEDIPPLLDHFMRELSMSSGKPARQFSNAAIELMRSYGWPGNVRQLRNTVEWVLIMKGVTGRDVFDVEDLPPEITGQAGSYGGAGQYEESSLDFAMLPLREARELFERNYLQSQIKRFGGNVSKTAQFIGMERSALHRKLKSLDILTSEKNDEPKSQNQKKRA